MAFVPLSAFLAIEHMNQPHAADAVAITHRTIPKEYADRLITQMKDPKLAPTVRELLKIAATASALEDYLYRLPEKDAQLGHLCDALGVALAAYRIPPIIEKVQESIRILEVHDKKLALKKAKRKRG